MAGDYDTEAFTDTLQRIAVIATPIIRTVARGSRFLPRVPWVLVSSTTRDLVEGSGLILEDAGTHELKGIAGERRLFRVAAPAD